MATQLIWHDGEVTESAPKSDAGERVVALDAETESVLKAHRAKQAQYRLALGPDWLDTGRVFTLPTGALLNPSWVSDHFDRLVKRSGLPPIRPWR